MSEAPVRVDRGQGFWTITLNRPDKLNAFNEAMHAGLRDALESAATDPACRALILTGAGRAFCAGQDLDERMVPEGGTPPDLGATLEAGYNPLVRRLRALPIPIVAAVNGVAAGAGANVALACDIVLAARSAKFIQAFARIGLIPDSGGTWFLPRLVGSARARALALLAEPVTAGQAEAWGMIWRSVEDARLMDEATALALRLAKGPTIGLGLIKEALDASSGNALEAQLDLECRLQREAGRTPDYAEGVRAFTEKRAPRFTGKNE
jgi:2-(1,2-epoxy-1,2-dihydrophenyl)acetyl-CoA isomerase